MMSSTVHRGDAAQLGAAEGRDVDEGVLVEERVELGVMRVAVIG